MAIVTVAVSALAFGCTGDDDGGTLTIPVDAATHDSAKADTGGPAVDSGGSTDATVEASGDTGAGTGDDDAAIDAGTGDAGHDSGTDTGAITDASDAGHTADAADSAPPPNYCATQSGLAFCADFDTAGPADAGALAAWDSVVSAGTEVSISNGRASSSPNSLLIALTTMNGATANPDRSAKVVKMLAPAAKVTQAVYEFDIYLDTLPKPGAGGFVTDWQFSDALGNGGSAQDTFGFRIAVFSDANGAFEHAELQHNAPALVGAPPDDVINPFPLVGKKWNHVKMVAAYSGTGGNNTVAFQAYVDSATAVVNKTYAAPFAQAPFVRVADGVVFAFDGNSKDYGLSFDNVTLKLQ